jgi:RNA polymerase sigma-70 factor (ECF subfamily)
MGESHEAMPPETGELVASAKRGDRSAFDELVRRTHADTYTLALRLCGNEEDARDVTQEAYLRAFKGLKRFRGDSQFSTWLYRITANAAATHMGKGARHRHEELDEGMALADDQPSLDPSLAAEASSLRDSVHDALEELSPPLRQVVVLRDVYDLPHEAIAAELGISESAAKVRLHRARRQLRDKVFGSRGDEDERSLHAV